MSIARKAKLNKKRPSSRSQSHSPVPIDRSSTPTIESSPLIVKRQISKDHERHSSPNVRHRPSSNHNRHRHQRSRSRDRRDRDSPRKRRRRSSKIRLVFFFIFDLK